MLLWPIAPLPSRFRGGELRSMPFSLAACFFVEEPPEITYEHGLFHVRQTIGGYCFERVMQPRVFFQSIARAVEASRQHRMGNVFPLVAAKDDHAASASGSPSK